MDVGSGKEIYVYFQAYKPPAPASGSPAPVPAPPQPLYAFVSLYQDGKKMYETQPKSILPEPAGRLGITPVNFDLGLDSLPRGKYDCRVIVLDPSTQKAAFWDAPIELVP